MLRDKLCFSNVGSLGFTQIYERRDGLGGDVRGVCVCVYPRVVATRIFGGPRPPRLWEMQSGSNSEGRWVQ